MTDEAADPRRTTNGFGEADGPAPRTREPDPHGQDPGRTGGHTDPGEPGHAGWTPGGQGYTASGPPPGSAAFTSRYGLVRPHQGRYLAGVCAAIGRATNTDPILWRVLLAVLGFFGGIGIVVYIAAWLIIPAEGDTASPVESMLGRGRSSMSPVLVIILGILVTVLFGYIVTDVSRAILLGAAILIGGALLLNRNANTAGRTPPAPPSWPAGPTPSAGPGGPVGPARATGPAQSASYAGPVAPESPDAAGAAPPSAGAPAATPPSAAPTATDQAGPATPGPSGTASDPDATPAYPLGPVPGAAMPHDAGPLAGTYPTQQDSSAVGSGYPTDPTVQLAPPASTSASAGPLPPAGSWPAPPTVSGGTSGTQGLGYRPPFAPHGPYASPDPRTTATIPPVRRAKRAKPPKPPRERSSLGAATFSLIFVVIGVVVILDLLNVVPGVPSTYFAAVLTTIALGLLVGTWFGRARWLIFLGLVASAALGISTLAESYEGEQARSPVVWRPTDHEELASRYQTRFSDAVLDLREIDFTGRDTEVEVRVNFGTIHVIVPPNVDTTVVAEVDAGEARIFDTVSRGFGQRPREITDLGADGAGGGSLRLLLEITGGDAEVSR